MEAVTIHRDEKHGDICETRIIGAYTERGHICYMTNAELSGSNHRFNLKLSRIVFGSGAEVQELLLMSDTLANLVAFYHEHTGGTTDDRAYAILSEDNANLRELHEGDENELVNLRRHEAELRDLSVANRQEIAALKARVAELEKQETFEVALLKDVCNKARELETSSNISDFEDMEAAVEAYDLWCAMGKPLPPTACAICQEHLPNHLMGCMNASIPQEATAATKE